MVTLLICVRAPETRAALERCALGVPGLDRVRSAADVTTAGAMVRSDSPDVVLIEAELPGAGPDLIRRWVIGAGAPRVIVLDSREDFAAMALALAAGASGFLRSDPTSAELAVLVAHAVSRDRSGWLGEPRRSAAAQVPLQRPALTEREGQVLLGMSEGKSNSEIGRELYLSEDTVKTHAQRLFRKMGVNDRAHAVASGFRMGLLC